MDRADRVEAKSTQATAPEQPRRPNSTDALTSSEQIFDGRGVVSLRGKRLARRSNPDRKRAQQPQIASRSLSSGGASAPTRGLAMTPTVAVDLIENLR